MMVSFLKTGDWFKENGIKSVEEIYPPNRYYCVLNMAFWSLLTLISFFYLGFKILISGNLLHIALFLIPIGLRKFS